MQGERELEKEGEGMGGRGKMGGAEGGRRDKCEREGGAEGGRRDKSEREGGGRGREGGAEGWEGGAEGGRRDGSERE